MGRTRLSPTAPTAHMVRPSAVLVALHPGPRGLEVLLTRRPWHLRTHAGEIAFPGGGFEPEDGVLSNTALREAQEEVGLAPADVELVGELGHIQTVSSGAEIVPFVGLLANRPALRGDPAEVAAILHVPVIELLDDAAWREEVWVRGDEAIVVTFFEIEGETVWGATARILRDLFQRVLIAS